jgi:ubiquinone/menaquinone biosynthesis C-methylase UbiE
MEHIKYRGQWGGKIESGEEMWWTEPNLKLRKNNISRFFFRLDVRQHFLLRFWNQATARKTEKTLNVVDYGCGTGGTTLNFANIVGQPIHGYDIFETQLKIGNDFSRQHQFNCQFKTLEKSGEIPVPEDSLDVIFSMDVLGHVPHIPTVLSYFHKALRPGGSVVLFTEATYSSQDRSIMARLAKSGYDMTTAVPEHISLFPREDLEGMFEAADFEVLERYSANVGHFFFFPKDYVTLLKGKNQKGIYWVAKIWDRVSKVLPFYPWPFQFLRLIATYLVGKKAYGTAYFYHLRKR